MTMGADTQQAPTQFSPEAQQIFDSLPADIQQRIMQLPPEQQEAAIMQMANMQQGAAEEQMEQTAPTDPNAQPMMKMGGKTKCGMYPKKQFGGYLDNAQLGDEIIFKHGSSLRKGKLTEFNPVTGKFKIQ